MLTVVVLSDEQYERSFGVAFHANPTHDISAKIESPAP